VTRPGLPIRWDIEVRHEGGFAEPVTVATTQAFLLLIDFNGIEPAPAASTTRGEWVVWEFDPPEGELLRVRFDAYTEVAYHSVPEVTTAVLLGDVPVVQTRHTTRVVP
jgi:hypothetical protein